MNAAEDLYRSEDDARERGQFNFGGKGLSHPRGMFGTDAAAIADVAAAVIGRIAVENFAVFAVIRQADAVAAAWYRGEVERNHDDCAVAGTAQK